MKLASPQVILDFVPNHTSDKHKWFEKSIMRESPYEDFFIWHNGTVEDDGTPILPNNWISVFSGPAWTFDNNRQQWYFHQFAVQQPDLNYRNSAVREEIKVSVYFLNDFETLDFHIVPNTLLTCFYRMY